MKSVLFKLFFQFLLSRILPCFVINKIHHRDGITVTLTRSEQLYFHYDLSLIKQDDEGIINLDITNTFNYFFIDNITAKVVHSPEEELSNNLPFTPSDEDLFFPVQKSYECDYDYKGWIYHIYFNNKNNETKNIFLVIALKVTIVAKDEQYLLSFLPILADRSLRISTQTIKYFQELHLKANTPKYFTISENFADVLNENPNVNFILALKDEIDMTITCGDWIIKSGPKNYSVNWKNEITPIWNLRSTIENCGHVVMKIMVSNYVNTSLTITKTGNPLFFYPKMHAQFSSLNYNFELWDTKKKYNIITLPYRIVTRKEFIEDKKNDIYLYVEHIYGEYTVKHYDTFTWYGWDHEQPEEFLSIIDNKNQTKTSKFNYTTAKSNLVSIQCSTPCSVNIIQFRNNFIHPKRNQHSDYLPITKDGVYYTILEDSKRYQFGFIQLDKFYYQILSLNKDVVRCKLESNEREFMLTDISPSKTEFIEVDGEFDADYEIWSVQAAKGAIVRVVLNSWYTDIKKVEMNNSEEYYLIDTHSKCQYFLMSFDDKDNTIDSYRITITKLQDKHEDPDLNSNVYWYSYYSYHDTNGSYILPSQSQSKPLVLRKLNNYSYKISFSNVYNKPMRTTGLIYNESKMYFVIGVENPDVDIRLKIDFTAIYKPKLNFLYNNYFYWIKCNDSGRGEEESFVLPKSAMYAVKSFLVLDFYRCDENKNGSYAWKYNSYETNIIIEQGMIEEERGFKCIPNVWFDYMITFNNANVIFNYWYQTQPVMDTDTMNDNYKILYNSKEKSLQFKPVISDAEAINYNIYINEYSEGMNKCAFVNQETPYVSLVHPGDGNDIIYRLNKTISHGLYWVMVVAKDNGSAYSSKIYDGIVLELEYLGNNNNNLIVKVLYAWGGEWLFGVFLLVLLVYNRWDWCDKGMKNRKIIQIELQ